jgi:hypothetical protein
VTCAGRSCGSARRSSGASAARSSPPAFGPIGLALVRREAEPGATVAVGDGATTATVVDLPFD